MHQLVEYLLGAVLLSQGLQAAEPAIPSVLGALIVVNAAVAAGPLAAAPRLPRPLHRIADVVLLAGIVLGAAAPSAWVTGSTRIVLGGVALVYGFVILRSDYSPKPVRARRSGRTRPVGSPGSPGVRPPPVPAADRSEALGRAAGRTTARLYNAARRRTRS
jgi:hypothetical protein